MKSTHFLQLFLIIQLVILTVIAQYCVEPSLPCSVQDGDVKLILMFTESCEDKAVVSTLIHSTAWLTERLHFLGVFHPFNVGVTTYKICDQQTILNFLVENSNLGQDDSFLGIVTSGRVDERISRVAQVLDVPFSAAGSKPTDPLISASVRLLATLQHYENVTVFSSDDRLLSDFMLECLDEGICVTQAAKNQSQFRAFDAANPIIFFGTQPEIISFTDYIISKGIEMSKLIIVPTDSSKSIDFPENSFVLLPTYLNTPLNLSRPLNIVPSTLLLDAATALLSRIVPLSEMYFQRCNDSTNKLSCLHSFTKEMPNYHFKKLTYEAVLQLLKIEPLCNHFNLNVFRMESIDKDLKENITENIGSKTDLKVLNKIASYNVINKTFNKDQDFVTIVNITYLEDCGEKGQCLYDQCLNFFLTEESSFKNVDSYIILKNEPWTIAILVVAGIGVIFCLAILTFVFVRICKRDLLEGNPLLTIILLLATIVMYASVVPFALEAKEEADVSTLSNALCLAKVLAATLTYSFVFSLMLGRSVMLATVANDAGFMSHVAGHIQALLSVFMCAVQAALSLQLMDNCLDILDDTSLIFLLSYDLLLLALLLFASPFIFQCQRNYKEGFYFTIATLLIAVAWSAWISAFIMLESQWKELTICVGLLATASILLGAIFVPRTYLMTSAIVRETLASTIPSLGLANSASILDLNYRNNQHLYDCVNITTVNAVQQNFHSSMEHSNPNFYSEEPDMATLPMDRRREILEEQSPDKVTRF